MKRSIPLSLALTLVFAVLSMSVVFADELETEEAVISETEINDIDVSASEESFELEPDEVSDDDLTADTEELIDADNMAMQPVEGNGTAGETVTDGVYKGVVNTDGTVTITGFASTPEGENIIIPSMIAGRKVTEIGEWAFYRFWAGGQQNLIIPDSIIKIDAGAFCSASFGGGIQIGIYCK